MQELMLPLLFTVSMTTKALVEHVLKSFIALFSDQVSNQLMY